MFYLNLPRDGKPFTSTKPCFNKVTLPEAIAQLKKKKRSSFLVIDTEWLQFQKGNTYLMDFIERKYKVLIDKRFFESSIDSFVEVYNKELPF